jgi:hypothetical protein
MALALHFPTLTVGTFTIYGDARKIRNPMLSAEWVVLRGRKAPNEAVWKIYAEYQTLTGVRTGEYTGYEDGSDESRRHGSSDAAISLQTRRVSLVVQLCSWFHLNVLLSYTLSLWHTSLLR